LTSTKQYAPAVEPQSQTAIEVESEDVTENRQNKSLNSSLKVKMWGEKMKENSVRGPIQSREVLQVKQKFKDKVEGIFVLFYRLV